jgi:hypothetical protein
MGLCPPHSEVGDSIVILAGCDFPVALRNSGSNCQLIGETYVQGFMDREVVIVGEQNSVFTEILAGMNLQRVGNILKFVPL